MSSRPKTNLKMLMIIRYKRCEGLGDLMIRFYKIILTLISIINSYKFKKALELKEPKIMKQVEEKKG